MGKEYLSPKDKERIAKVEASEAGKRFLRRKCKRVSTRALYVRGALLFSEFLNKSLDQIVNEYKKDAEENLYKAYDKWELTLEDFADDLKENHPKGSTALSYFSGAVALINANVPKSAEIHPKGPESTPRSIPPITIEDLKVVRDIADERQGAFIDVLKDTGMSRADTVTLTYKQVKKAIENSNIQYHKINVYRGKENVEYETWLGPNALESLRLYFKVRRQSGEQITDDTWIFALKGRKRIALTPRSLSTIFRMLTKKTGIKITTHRIRKFFETYITAGGAHPIVAKYWMGHSVASRDVEAKYIIPPENLQREIYLKAYNKIDLKQTSLAELQERQRISEELTDKLMRGEPFNEEDRKNIGRHGIRLREKAGRATNGGSTNDCPNGNHCPTFKEIDEDELLNHLNNGWHITHNLQSGKVIIQRD